MTARGRLLVAPTYSIDGLLHFATGPYFYSDRGFIVRKWFEASSYCIIFAHIRLFTTFPLCHIVSYCIRVIANFVVNILSLQDFVVRPTH